MFALLVPAGFAVVLKVGAHIDAHKKHRQACEKAKATSSFRGAAAGALPDADVELWRAKAELATERIQGLESIITVRGAARRGAAPARPCTRPVPVGGRFRPSATGSAYRGPHCARTRANMLPLPQLRAGGAQRALPATRKQLKRAARACA